MLSHLSFTSFRTRHNFKNVERILFQNKRQTFKLNKFSFMNNSWQSFLFSFCFELRISLSWKGPGPCTYLHLESAGLGHIAGRVICLPRLLPGEPYTSSSNRIVHWAGLGIPWLSFHDKKKEIDGERTMVHTQQWVQHLLEQWLPEVEAHSLELWAQRWAQIGTRHPASHSCMNPIPGGFSKASC